MKLKLLVIALLYVTVFAEDDYDKAFKDFEPYPSDINKEVDKWVEPYDPTFLPYVKCGEVENLEVVSVADSVKKYYDHKDNIGDYLTNGHYFCVASVVRVTYRVTCLNKLKYEGIHYFFSDPYKEKDPMIGSNDDIDKKFTAWEHGWIERDLSCLKKDGTFNESCFEYNGRSYSGYDGNFNESALKEQWAKQKVAYPAWNYTGVPGKKLARPVIFVHGLNSSYDTWGVEPLTDVSGEAKKAEDSFQKGLVKKYLSGSAPDILARTQNIDNSEANINKNGIYFYQAPGRFKDSGEWEEFGLEWDGKNASNSQSRKLYQQLISVLDEFYGADEIDGWKNHSEEVIDLVTHSQGGLVVREMLRGVRAQGKDLIGPQNAANHIGKIITVDTPHFGSELAVANTEDIESEFPSLKLVIDDLDAQEKGTPEEHDLITAKLDLHWYSYASRVAIESIDGYTKIFGTDGPQAILGALFPVAGILGWAYGATTDWATDFTLTVKGPYVGEYVPEIFVDAVGPYNPTIKLGPIKTMDSVSQEVRRIRRLGAHLDKNSSFMQKLIDKYPQRPDGSNVEILPLYSPSTKRFLADLLYSLGEEADKLCEENDESEGCFAAGSYFKTYAMKMAEKQGVAEITDVDFDDTLWNALIDVQDNWLSQSDVAVTEYSQKFQDPGVYGISSDLIPELKNPRSYMYHDALAPWEDVLHMPVKNMNDGSTRQGLDISCALDFYCDKILQKDDAKLIYLNEGSVVLTGNFDISPMFMERGIQEVKVSDGTSYLKASYAPNVGSTVSYTDEKGNVVQDIVLDAAISTTPSISRDGLNITVSFNNYSGKMYAKTYLMAKLSPNITYSIGNGNVGALPKVVAGVANVTDPATQMPPSTPKDKFYAKSSVFAMHREARGDYEVNTSRPRILVANASDNDINGFKVVYYFTADPARKPVVEVDYPNIPITLENLGGDQWRFVLNGTDSVIKAHSVFPNIDGWQIRVHYSDWFDYKHLNDWSADYNTGIPTVNRKIVVYNSAGEILWGAEPQMFKSSDDGIIASPKGTISWKDAAPWEKNMFKPQVSVSNTGGVNLQNYHAKMWFRVPVGKTLQQPPKDWYTPESRPSLANIGGNVWELDMYFDRHILYSKESVTEGDVGLHLTDWSDFDKTVCGIALLDSEGNVIYGQIPSVEKCESYDGPNLLMNQYAWGF